MTISFSYYETLVFIHQHLVEIISFLTLGIVIMAIILIVNARNKRKTITSARKLQGYKIFSPQEWDTFLKNVSHVAAESVVQNFDVSPKGDDFKKKLCGTWCNSDDTRRYYISNRGGFFVLMIEERITPKRHQTTYILRSSTEPADKHVFYVDSDICMTFGYDPDEDIIFNPVLNEELERYEEHIRRNTTESNPGIKENNPQPSDIMETLVESVKESNQRGL